MRRGREHTPAATAWWIAAPSGMVDPASTPSGVRARERLGGLEFNVWLAAADITDDRAGAAEFMSAAFGVEPTAALESPMLLVGTVEQVIDDLLRRRARWGYSYITIPVGVARAFAPVVEALA